MQFLGLGQWCPDLDHKSVVMVGCALVGSLAHYSNVSALAD